MRAGQWWRLVSVVCIGAAACDGQQPDAHLPPPGLRQEVEASATPTRDELLRSLAPPSLKTVEVPRPRELGRYVRDEAAAIALGKAFFWDMQVGSDGQVACATCHFHAGADARVADSRHPGHNGVKESTGPALTARDFPFRRLADPSDVDSAVLSDSDDVVGSQGVPRRLFTAIQPGTAVEEGSRVNDPSIPGDPRQVTDRNAPSVINSVFNFRNFWDGRASHFFNGESAFGPADPEAGVWVDDGAGLVREPVRLENASLASQAVGPPLNSVEMSWDGRPKPLLGRKLLTLRPMAEQRVHPEDSVLGALVHPSGLGLRVAYEQLIRTAFQPRFWSSPQRTPDGYSQLEANFALFWGLSLQLYQSTLVSDDTPFDRYVAGADDALTEVQKDGMLIFYTHGRCGRCHSGPEFTAASVSNVVGEGGLVARMELAQGTALYDTGFYNLGVRPPAEDVGLGGRDPLGNPLSYAWRLARSGPDTRLDVCSLRPEVCPLDALFDLSARTPRQLPFVELSGVRSLSDWLQDGLLAHPSAEPFLEPPLREPVAVEGTFKTPGLRNVELTGPYMHNGSLATLGQVMEFYHRGGNFPEENRASLDAHILRISLENAEERNALVAFLQALTDERVRLEKAPFDHPELILPGGQRVPAVGAGGGAPLLPFEQLLRP